jgi:tRNA A58 N-methylase Trm61
MIVTSAQVRHLPVVVTAGTGAAVFSSADSEAILRATHVAHFEASMTVQPLWTQLAKWDKVLGCQLLAARPVPSS